MNQILKNLSALALCTGLPMGAWADAADDTLHVAVARETDFIDPIHTSSADGDLFATILYDTLIYVDRATREFKPALAESWSWLDDTTVEFRLREGITFHNGEAFNADDVVYTFGLLMDMNNGFRQQQQDFGNIAEVTKVDDWTVRVRLSQPQPTFENLLASRIAIWPDDYTSANGHMIHATAPVGTGPYRLDSLQAGSVYTLSANADYAAHARPAPTIGHIEVRVIPEIQTQIAEVMAGQLDLALSFTPGDAQMLEGMPGVTVQYGPATRMYFLSMDAAGEGENPLADRRVRQAITWAINRPEMTAALISPSAPALTSQCNPAQNFCLTDIEPANGYDLEAARAALAEAGHAEGLDLRLMAEASLRPVAEAIQGYLSQIGIRLAIDTMPLPAWRTAYINGESQMSIVGWGSGVTSADVSNTLGIFFNGSSTDYVQDPDLIAWTAEARQSMDPAHRTELYRQVYTRINEEAYVVPLYGVVATYVTSEDVDFPVPVMDFPDLSLVRWAE